MFTSNQKGVVSAAPFALTITVASLFFTREFHQTLADHGWALPTPVAVLLISFWLIFSIGTVANKRFLHEDSIGGSVVDKPDGRVSIDKSILQNTFEQVVLASIVYTAFAYIVGERAHVYLATLVTLFFIGRLCFYVGYKNGARGRAFGFGLTFYPTVLTYIYLVLKFFFF